MSSHGGGFLFESSEPATALAWLTKVPVHVRAERKLVLLQEAILNTMVGKTHVAAEVIGNLTQRVALSGGDLVAVNAGPAPPGWTPTPPKRRRSPPPTPRSTPSPITPHDEIPDVFGLTSAESVRFMALISRARALWYRGDVRACPPR